MYNILKDADVWKSVPRDMLDRLSIRQATFPRLEKRIMKFIETMEHNSAALNPSAIQQHAIDLVEEDNTLLNDHEMPKFSKGWVQNLMRRNNLQKRAMHGEAGSVRIDHTLQDRLTVILDAIALYLLKDVYNMDESGLLYKNAPNNTISEHKVAGVKMDKTRFTVTFLCNADGSDKYAVVGVLVRCQQETMRVQSKLLKSSFPV